MLENNEIKTVRGSIAGKPVTYETGRLAKQAGGAVLATMGGTVVLAAGESASRSQCWRIMR